MAPLKSSLARTVGKLLGVNKDTDLSLRGDVQSSRRSIPPISATGGTEYTYNGKKIHAFTSTGPNPFSFTGEGTVEYVIVAGGGAGAANHGGGGGAGGYRTGTVPISGPGNLTVTVGAGGAIGANPPQVGSSGDPSSVNFPGSTITTYGGGQGAGPSVPGSSGNGGSGGGGVRGSGTWPSVDSPRGWGLNPSTPAPIIGGFPNYVPGTTTGYPGGDNQSTASEYGGGGGGGAGGAGEPTLNPGGDGGIGIQIPTTFRDPSNPYGNPGPNSQDFWVAGGGGGGAHSGSGGVGGGPGGPYAGGANGGNAPGNAGSTATANTGGGGGGGASGNANGGAGGSGIVLIAYPE